MRPGAVAVICTLSISGCGGGDAEAPPAAGTPGGTAGETAPAPDTATAPSPALASGPEASGTGYRLTMPDDGWEDITEAFAGSAVRVDLGIAGPVAGDVRTNVVVIHERPKGSVRLEPIGETLRSQAQSLADGPLEPTRPTELDGEPAVTWSYDSKSHGSGAVGRQQQVVCVRDGSVYTITFTASRPGFAGQRAALEAVLASWRWT